MKQMSYVSAIQNVLDGKPVEGEIRERLEALKVSIEKRSEGKTSKTQKANAGLCEQIIESLERGVTYSLADVAALIPSLNGAPPQKVGPLCRKLAVDGKLAESHSKGKAFYTLA